MTALGRMGASCPPYANALFVADVRHCRDDVVCLSGFCRSSAVKEFGAIAHTVGVS
jgi:hypothetical protein